MTDSSERLPPRPLFTRGGAVVAWLVGAAVFALALALDRPIAERLTPTPIVNKHDPWVWWVKRPGDFRFTLVLAAVVTLLHHRRLRAGGFILLCGVTAGLFYTVFRWGVGRYRPVFRLEPFDFHPFVNGIHGLFYEQNLSFPSGHACLSFATASALGILIPRWKFAFFPFAAVVAVERLLENAHYLSDVLFGSALGVLAAHAALWFGQKVFGPGDEARPALLSRPARLAAGKS